MPAPRVITPSMSGAQQIADQALDIAEGVTIEFFTLQYGSLQAAASASRAFQVAFCNLRARTRRKAAKEAMEMEGLLDAFAKGPYDVLACTRAVMPNGGGWQVTLLPAIALQLSYSVRSNATGEQLNVVDPDMQRVLQISAFFLRKWHESQKIGIPFRNPLEEEQIHHIWEKDPDTAAALYGDLFPPPEWFRKPAEEVVDTEPKVRKSVWEE